MEVERACLSANCGLGKYWLVECVEQTFTANPVHLTLGSVAPGAGAAALGPTLMGLARLNQTEIALSGIALMSTVTSWLVEAKAVLAMPAIEMLTAGSPRSGIRVGLLIFGASKSATLMPQVLIHPRDISLDTLVI